MPASVVMSYILIADFLQDVLIVFLSIQYLKTLNTSLFDIAYMSGCQNMNTKTNYAMVLFWFACECVGSSEIFVWGKGGGGGGEKMSFDRKRK